MAARVYFGKPVKAVTLREAALLAGLIRGPSIYSPYRNFGLAKVRQETVLARMAALGTISTQGSSHAGPCADDRPRGRRVGEAWAAGRLTGGHRRRRHRHRRDPRHDRRS